MKALVAQFRQETNSFSPIVCGMQMFENNTLISGQDVMAKYADSATDMSGILAALKESHAEIVPSIAAQSVSSGPVSADVYEHVLAEIVRDIEANRPLDAVLLWLHGAMILTNHYDGTGKFLSAVKAAVGKEVYIGAALDLHANLTSLMLSSADVLVAYRTYPHVDLYDTGHRMARLLMRVADTAAKPKPVLVKLPMLLPAEGSQTDSQPMKRIMDLARDVETRAGILSASVFQVQPWLDVQDTGCSVLVIAEQDEQAARSCALEIAELFWNLRTDFEPDLVTIENGIQFAANTAKGPVILGDSADGTGSGSPGDSTAILEALVATNANVRAYLSVVDPESVAMAESIGVGKEGEFNIGAKIDTVSNKPVKLMGRVRMISDGRFVFKGPQATGVEHQMGKTAVIQSGAVSIVVMQRPAFNWDPELYRSVGLEPRDAQLVVVKSPLAFRAAYRDIALEMYVVDAPGASSPRLASLPFEKILRPMYPMDDIGSFQPRIITV